MNIKRIIFAAIGVFAISFFAVMMTVGTSSQVSAEDFAKNFAAKSVDNHTKGENGTYNFDKAHSFINFRVKHMGLIEVPGYFRDFSGTVVYDAKDMKKSSVEFTAKMESVDTGVEARDNHLRTADFFEVEKYPEMIFKSTKIEKKGKDWMVTGNLTMKDVTKEITFPFNIAGFAEQRGTMKMGITAETTINRRDFNVNYGGDMPNGTPVLSNDVKINLQIEAAIQKKEEGDAKKADSK